MKAAIIGTGMMGPGIAMTLTLGGWDAVILGRTQESAEAGLRRARTQLAMLAGNGLVTPEQGQFSEEHLTASTGLDDAVSAAELVIESGPEQMAFKQELFARMDGLTRPECLLASNTSGLSITAVAERCVHPERVMTTHFWNPPHLMPLVEIVMGKKTSLENGERMRGILESCGKVPVLVKKDTPGQLGNRLQMAMVREAAHIVSEGIADAEEVDMAVRMGFGLRFPMYGLLEHMDIVGLDMSMGILEYVSTDLYSRAEPPAVCRELLESGNLGAKTGKGFYDWSVRSADETRARRDAFVLQMLRWSKGQ